MAEVSKPCNVYQAYNFKRDLQDTVGHITSMKIGDKKLSADTSVKKPTNEETEETVGVVRSFYWDGGYADPIHFDCQISTANKQDVSLLVHEDMSNTDVEFEFNIYDYDPVKKKWYPSILSGDTALKGLIAKSGSELQISIADDPSHEVESPANYAFSVGIMPQDKEQVVHMAVSTDKKFAKRWGVKVS